MAFFSNIARDTDLVIYTVESHIDLTLTIILSLGVVHFINKHMNYKLNYLGILPRHPIGLLGIFFAPFLHGDFNHYFFNCFPLFALMHMILLAGTPAFYVITLIIMVVGGLLTWLLARRNFHVGASSVIMGYFGYIAVQSYLAPSFVSIMALGICLFYFGGLVTSLLPTDKSVSWEGHTFGFLAGIAAFYLAPVLLGQLSF